MTSINESLYEIEKSKFSNWAANTILQVNKTAINNEENKISISISDNHIKNSDKRPLKFNIRRRQSGNIDSRNATNNFIGSSTEQEISPVDISSVSSNGSVVYAEDIDINRFEPLNRF